MARHYEPTPEDVEGYQQWLAERPPEVRAVAERFNPWTLYCYKLTGQRVFFLGCDEVRRVGGGPIEVTVRIGVTGQFNLVAFDRNVFGVKPDDLEECDLPSPDEPVGAFLTDPADIAAYIQELADAPTIH